MNDKDMVNEALKTKGINEIKIKVKINEEDINKKIYFLDSSKASEKYEDYENSYKEEENNEIVNGDHLKKMNKSNVELYNNNKKYEYKKYFTPEKEDIYSIIIKLNSGVEDCSWMLGLCFNIIYIDLSYFNSSKVRNLAYMFNGCYNLEFVNLSSFNTSNVTNMEYLFNSCFKLTNIYLDSFDKKMLLIWNICLMML